MPQEIKPGVLAVTELPEDAREFNIGPFTGNLNYFTGTGILMSSIGLPPGQWSILGWSDELTQEQCKSIVDWYEDSNDTSYDPQYNVTTYFDVFTNYETGDEGDLDTATESFASLLRSHGIDRALIIKKEKL